MRILVTLLLAVLVLQTNQTVAQQYNFKTYTSKQGLGSSTVNCIFQDSRGDIWFGTQSGGISSFNGSSFKSFTKSNGLVGNDITCITEDNFGNIWVGTSEGASLFDGQDFRNYTDSTGLNFGVGVYSIFVDDENTVWFGTRGGGLVKYDGETFVSFKKEDGLPSDNVYSITQTNDKRIWLACAKGIASYNGIECKTFEETRGKTYFSTLSKDGQKVWFGGTPGNGVLEYYNGEFTPLKLPEEVENDFFGSITEDDLGNLWIATDHGLLKYGKEGFQLYTREMGLSVNGVFSVLSDYEGNIWVGTFNGGVNVLTNEAFVNYTDKQGLSEKTVNVLTVDDKNDRLIIGTSRGGLNVLSLNGQNSFKKIDGIAVLEEVNVAALTVDDQNQVWVGSDKGLYILKDENGLFTLKNSIDIQYGNRLAVVNGIIQNNQDDYWISTFGLGLIRIQGDSLTYHNVKTGFFSDNLHNIFKDKQGNLWIGTQDAGVIKYDGNEFISLIDAISFPDPTVWAIAQDSEGAVYFGTGENGLCRYDGDKLKTYDMMFGSFSNRVKSLHWSSSSSYLWVGTPEGVHKAKFDVGGNIIEMRTYSENDGLLTFEIDQNAIDIDNEETVWFGATNGITAYRPKNDKPNLLPPRIRLEKMLLAYEPVNWSEYADSVDPFTGIPVDLILDHTNNNLTFNVKAITTDKVNYSFKLEGQDENWTPYNVSSSIQYSNIELGTYTLRAKAINSNRVESEAELSYSFTISPPWWSLWYVRTGFVLAVIILVVLIVKGREKVLKEQNQFLEKTVAERTEEVVQEKKQVEQLYNRSEELLLNILPAQTAEELKTKGHVDAELLDEVTVLFTDFKGFTALSEQLTPNDLVKDIHECFSEFDRIMQNHGIEKIKTIGDSYMAAGGLPEPNSTHAVDVVTAALEMVEFVEKGKVSKKLKGLPFFEVRIGVHTGPVVAGIVGIKKFQYDIWGDTVNTASRMESSGEAGKINISESTYQLVKDQFNCEHRGKVAAKGKGAVDMYFVKSLNVKS